MRPTSSGSLFFALFLATACSTTRLALGRIESPREVPLSYRTGWESGALESCSTPSAIATDPSAARVRVSLVQLSTGEIETLFGPVGARSAARVRRRAARRAIPR